jgi:glycosyltransferase involved in cell wall biosynthesis
MVTDVQPLLRVLADTWYATLLSPTYVCLQARLERLLPAWLVRVSRRSGVLRGLLIFLLSGPYDAVILGAHGSGTGTVVVLEALLRRRRRIILLEFMHGQPISRRRMVYPIWFALIRRPAVRTVLLLAHTLTEFERDRYARLYHLPRDRFAFVPWPLRYASDTLPPFTPAYPNAVVCSGRAACDWETLFRAARSARWFLTVVCSAADLSRVEKLNECRSTRVLSEITTQEHHALVSSAAVYVLCLHETDASAGQVRLMTAVRAGTPVVATRVHGLDGYALDGVTALVVDRGDAIALRDRVDQLLSDRAQRERLRTNAFEHAGSWTFEQYVARLHREIAHALALECRRSRT